MIVVDNSGKGLVRPNAAPGREIRVIEPRANVGFGAAVNLAFRHSRAPYLATLNDDAIAHPDWLGALVSAIGAHPDAGMCASQVRMFGKNCLDSAGMLICGDATGKQRGHMAPPDAFSQPDEVLFPSGSAALYRRTMLEETGLFDEDFFLYCEDTDLGLRARWAGWKCLYVPGAVVEHHYSHSAGRASPLKAYYVERNRLRVVVKNFPATAILAAPFFSLARYWWHAFFILRSQGSAARFREDGNSGIKMVFYVLRAHCALLVNLRSLLRKRRQIRRSARISPAAFRTMLKSHSISPRQVAEL